MWDTWTPAVFSLITSSVAICGLVRPWAISSEHFVLARRQAGALRRRAGRHAGLRSDPNHDTGAACQHLDLLAQHPRAEVRRRTVRREQQGAPGVSDRSRIPAKRRPRASRNRRHEMGRPSAPSARAPPTTPRRRARRADGPARRRLGRDTPSTLGAASGRERGELRAEAIGQRARNCFGLGDLTGPLPRFDRRARSASARTPSATSGAV